MNIAYIRVSTEEQNDLRQIEALRSRAHIDEEYIEKVSAKDTNRPKLQEMINYARKGDTIYVHDFSRLARSTTDLLNIVKELKEKGVNLVSNKESFDTSTATGMLMLTVIGAINEFERNNMLERQREGIAIAKREKKFKGGQPKDVDMVKYKKLSAQLSAKEISKSEMAKQLGICRPTLYRILGEQKQ